MIQISKIILALKMLEMWIACERILIVAIHSWVGILPDIFF